MSSTVRNPKNPYYAIATFQKDNCVHALSQKQLSQTSLAALYKPKLLYRTYSRTLEVL